MSTFLILFAAGCEDFSLEQALDNASGAADTAASDDGDETDDSGGASDAFIAAWYTFAARFDIVGGEPTTDNASVRFVLGDAALVRQDCDDLDLASLVVADPPASGFYAQWTLTVPADVGCSAEPFETPATVSLAIGPLDPEVRAQLGTVGLDQEASHLWGASFSADGSALAPFAYVQGAADADASSALVDGTYVVEPLLLQPVAAAE